MEKAHILGLATDLFFQPAIGSAVAELGYESLWLSEYRTATEFIQLLRTEKPALIILDLNSALPWIEWLPAAKADPVTSQIPWLAFGSHMKPRRLAAARRAGADKVVPKSQFSAELTDLMKGTLGQMLTLL